MMKYSTMVAFATFLMLGGCQYNGTFDLSGLNLPLANNGDEITCKNDAGDIVCKSTLNTVDGKDTELSIEPDHSSEIEIFFGGISKSHFIDGKDSRIGSGVGTANAPVIPITPDPDRNTISVRINEDGIYDLQVTYDHYNGSDEFSLRVMGSELGKFILPIGDIRYEGNDVYVRETDGGFSKKGTILGTVNFGDMEVDVKLTVPELTIDSRNMRLDRESYEFHSLGSGSTTYIIDQVEYDNSPGTEMKLVLFGGFHGDGRAISGSFFVSDVRDDIDGTSGVFAAEQIREPVSLPTGIFTYGGNAENSALYVYEPGNVLEGYVELEADFANNRINKFNGYIGDNSNLFFTKQGDITIDALSGRIDGNVIRPGVRDFLYGKEQYTYDLEGGFEPDGNQINGRFYQRDLSDNPLDGGIFQAEKVVQSTN